jgi:hypothetical protein
MLKNEMNVNHWLIYMNNACLVVKRVTIRIVNCRPRDCMVNIHSKEGSPKFICCCGPGKNATSVDKYPSVTEESMEFSVGNQ